LTFLKVNYSPDFARERIPEASNTYTSDGGKMDEIILGPRLILGDKDAISRFEVNYL